MWKFFGMRQNQNCPHHPATVEKGVVDRKLSALTPRFLDSTTRIKMATLNQLENDKIGPMCRNLGVEYEIFLDSLSLGSL